MASVNGSFTAPTARQNGKALALADIDHFSLVRNGVEIQKLAPAGPRITWADLTAVKGKNLYTAFTLAKDGLISNTSNDAVVTA